ncbi:MAG TPA: serine/threonine-protein kinase, partial [Actinomycetota bacterium]|nr:serine/threonine-protein kinase [Actinomycetota bacterium]
MIPPGSGSSEVKLGGRYRLTSRIARGTLADFWRCEDEVLGRPVAAKILRPDLVSDPTIRRLFRREAVAAARLSHSNIVSVFDTGEHEGAPFIVMEYLGGGSLRERLEKGPLAPEVVAQIGADICAALGHAHRAGILHGDIRPENILFSEGGHLKVSDFAIAKAAKVNPRLTDPEGNQNASLYAAPELGQGAQPDPRSDLYSVGVILYECLIGMTPVAAARKAAATAGATGGIRIPAPRDLRPETPEELDLAVIGALQRDPAARFQNARSLERVLRRLAPATLPSAGRQAPRARPVPQAAGPVKTQASPAARPEPAPVPRAAAPPPAPAAGRRAAARGRAPGDSFLRTEGRWMLPTILVIAAAAALVLTIPSVRTGIGNVVAPLQPESEAEPIAISRAQAYDPPPGD